MLFVSFIFLDSTSSIIFYLCLCHPRKSFTGLAFKALLICSSTGDKLIFFVSYIEKVAFIVIWIKTCHIPLSTSISKDTLTQAHTLWSVLMRSSVGEGVAFTNIQASALERRAFASAEALIRHTCVLIKLIQTLLLHQVCVSHPVSSAASLMRVAWHFFLLVSNRLVLFSKSAHDVHYSPSWTETSGNLSLRTDNILLF